MTETTEATRTAGPTIGPDVNRAEPPAPIGSTDLALHYGQRAWNEEQTVQLRSMGLEHATDADLKLLHHYAARTGLDPFTKQVYMVSRRTKVKVRVLNEETGNTRIEEQDVDKFTVQVGIDGWRVIGNRAARRDGIRVAHLDTMWRGKGTEWRDYWDDDDGKPVACKYIVEFDGVRVSATCNYSEYVQLVRGDQGVYVPNSMWAKMPANQIAKCAEALAWRKAFPADYSGLVLEDAAQPEIIDGEVIAEGAPAAAAKAEPRKAGGATRNAQRAARATAAPDPEPPKPRPMTAKQRSEFQTSMFVFLNRGAVTERDDQLAVIAELAALDALPEHRDKLPDAVLHAVTTKLAKIAAATTVSPDDEAETASKAAMSAAMTDVLAAWVARQPDPDDDPAGTPPAGDDAAPTTGDSADG